MVPLSLNFYEIRTKVRREILRRLNDSECIDNPIGFSWLVYALQWDVEQNDPVFRESLKTLERWAVSEDSRSRKRYLAPLALCKFLSEREEVKTLIDKRIREILNEEIERTPRRPTNILNKPDQLFCVSLVIEDKKLKKKLYELIRNIFRGPVERKVLLLASLRELGERTDFHVEELENPETLEETIYVLWLAKRYGIIHGKRLIGLWQTFEKLSHQLEIDDNNENTSLMESSLAFLYEAVVREISKPDPMMIFDLYPLHPEIKKIARAHFANGKYPSAVFQAVQKMRELIERVSGKRNMSETNLVRDTMNPKELRGRFVNKSINQIKIKFNDRLDDTSGENEQEGLALIAEGIVKAFRHPKGHRPEDDPLIEMGPYEALDQLITIDYIMKRIQKAV